jgi:hypothetical protein
MAVRGRSILSLLFLLIAVMIVWVMWRINNREAYVDREAPAEAKLSQVEFAGSQPKEAFHLEQGNVLARTVYSTAGPANSEIEIRDFEFPPHVKTHLAGLPGPGVLEVYSGHGSLSLGGNSEDLTPGVIKATPARQALDFDNQGDFSLVLRVYLVEGR